MGRALSRSQVQPPAQRKANFAMSPGCSGLFFTALENCSHRHCSALLGNMLHFFSVPITKKSFRYPAWTSPVSPCRPLVLLPCTYVKILAPSFVGLPVCTDKQLLGSPQSSPFSSLKNPGPKASPQKASVPAHKWLSGMTMCLLH